MAFTTIAGLAAGTTAVTTATVLAAVAEVGLALTVVGAVTGNKTLLKIGGVMSLVGGVGGMIAGATSGAAGAAGGLTEAGTASALEAASAEAMGAYGGTAAAEAATQGIVGGMEGAVSAGTDMLAPAMDSGFASSAGQMSMTPPAAESSGIVSQTQAAPTVNDIATPQGVQMQTPTGPQAPTGVKAPTGATAPTDSGSFFGKFSSFAEKNKTLFNSGLKVVGGMMEGANEGEMWDEKMALERDRLKQSSYGNTTSNFAPRRGIIQGAR